MGTPQQDGKVFGVNEAEPPLTTPQTSPTPATPQTLPRTLSDVRRFYSWTKRTKMNKRIENILLIVNISQVGGWKTKF